MIDQELAQRLEYANVTCSSCGEKYGTYCAQQSSWWTGICHVCGNAGLVTQSKDFGYFITSILRLESGDDEDESV